MLYEAPRALNPECGELLQVALHLADRPGDRARRVVAVLAPGPPLAQQVPALVESLLHGPQLGVLLLGGQLARGQPVPQLVLGADELVYVPENFLVFHEAYGTRPGARPAMRPGRRPARAANPWAARVRSTLTVCS